MNKLKIFCDARLGEDAEKLLREGVGPHELVFPATLAASVLAKSGPDPAFDQADIAFGQPDVANIQRSNRLRWMHLSSAGYTRYDTPVFRAVAAAKGFAVTNSSSVYAEPCAEHVFSFILAQARRLPPALASRCANDSPEWARLRYTCAPLRGQNVLILGFGAIATRLVELLRPFEMRITAFRRQARGDEGIPIILPGHLSEALGKADHVVNILPLNVESAHFISAERLARMKPGAILYNIGRGATIDQEALVAALRSGQLGAAWLDVTEPEPLPDGHPLLGAPNCFITPHIAGGHRNEFESLVRHFLDNLRRFLDGAPLSDRVM
jgi:phosphoglycerate dehydrogenase-like enzyme